MPKYTWDYGPRYEETLIQNLHTEKERSMLGKEIQVLLENPTRKAITVEGYQDPVLWRKHVCAETKRLIYIIHDNEKVVIFVAVLPKSDKRLYKNLYKYL